MGEGRSRAHNFTTPPPPSGHGERHACITETTPIYDAQLSGKDSQSMTAM